MFGGSAGGPIVRNKAFWFVNVERNLQQQAANLNSGKRGAPGRLVLDTTDFTGWNTFVRSDYQLTGNNHLSFRWVREAVLTENDELEGNNSTPDNHLRERQRRPGLQLRRDVGVGQPGDQRVQSRPRP